MEFPAMIFDTSAVMALLLQEDEGEKIEEIIESLLEHNGQIIVPPLFWYEAGNTLVTAVNRNRITEEEMKGLETDLGELPIATDSLPGPEVRMRIRDIAAANGLSYYDSAYVELHRRLKIPLISFDTSIQKLIDEVGI